MGLPEMYNEAMPSKTKSDVGLGGAGNPGQGPASFEKGMEDLDRMVKELERGDLPLEQSIALYEQAVALSESCRKLLQEAETRVETLRAATAARAVAVEEEGPEDAESGEDESDEDIPF